MAARKRKIKLDENWRGRIQCSMLINRLQDHALGQVEMSDTQIRAALGLLKKVAPDLSSTDIKAEVDATVTNLPVKLVDA